MLEPFPPPIYETGTGENDVVSIAKSIVHVATPNYAAETIYVPARYQGPRWEAILQPDALVTIKTRIPFHRVKRIVDKVPSLEDREEDREEDLGDGLHSHLPSQSAQASMILQDDVDRPLTGTQVLTLYWLYLIEGVPTDSLSRV
jgi:hypothetical protein